MRIMNSAVAMKHFHPHNSCTNFDIDHIFVIPMKTFFLVLLMCTLISQHELLYAQTTSSITFSAFADLYYAFDVNQPRDFDRQFTTQPLRHNEFNLNFAYVSAQYASQNARGRFALQTGTYVRSNYAAEPADLRMIHEASVGVRLAEGVWLDMGIMPSHIGLESAVSKDNWNYSRSLIADYSPYYETGIKLTGALTENLTASVMVLNGWQNIQETNSSKALGTQVQWKPGSSTLVNWSTFLGNEQPTSSPAQRRFFNNVFVQHQLSSSWDIAFGVDAGVQGNEAVGQAWWWGSAMLCRYTFADRWKIGGRLEHYSDPHGIIVPISSSIFRLSGASFNIDYSPSEQSLIRFEARGFSAEDAIFIRRRTMSRYNGFFVLSCSVWM